MKDVFIENLESGVVLEALIAAGYDAKEGRMSSLDASTGKWGATGTMWGTYININGFRSEYHRNGVFKFGWNKKYNTEQLDSVYDELCVIYDATGFEVMKTPAGNDPNRVGYSIDLVGASTPEEFIEFCQNIESIISGSEVIKSTSRTTVERGVSFEGTFFSDLKERGATMGGMFGNMVCEASGMKLVNMKAEKYTSSGEIDGVEYDDNLNIISIYECQSGIHHGSFLDDNHLDKSLGRYLYDPEIIPTVRKVVILAGGYTKQHLNILKERSSELANRKQPIEIVLLRTVAADTKVGIGIEVVELS